MNPIRYFAEVKTELALVVWPRFGEVIKLTLIVVLISLIVGLYLGGLDAGFTKLIGFLLNGH